MGAVLVGWERSGSDMLKTGRSTGVDISMTDSASLASSEMDKLLAVVSTMRTEVGRQEKALEAKLDRTWLTFHQGAAEGDAVAVRACDHRALRIVEAATIAVPTLSSA